MIRAGLHNARPTKGLDADTVELTVKTLLSHLITKKVNSPINYLRMSYVRVEPWPTVARYVERYGDSVPMR
eukprot:219324-Pyramimonas_sp.AAC.1